MGKNENIETAEPEIAAAKTRDVPALIVEVRPDASVSHDGETHYGEDYPTRPPDAPAPEPFKLDGVTAIALVQAGAVQIVGSE